MPVKPQRRHVRLAIARVPCKSMLFGLDEGEESQGLRRMEDVPMTTAYCTHKPPRLPSKFTLASAQSLHNHPFHGLGRTLVQGSRVHRQVASSCT